MKNYLILLLVFFAFSCKQKKIDLSGNSPVKITDFITAFPLIETQFTTADSTLTKYADSTVIGYKVFAQFIPDSVLSRMKITNKQTIIQPVGRIEKQKETYLLATFTLHKKTILATFVLDKKNKFLAAKELLNNNDDDDYSRFVSVNREPTFLISRERLNADKQLQFTRVGWVYNSSGNFMVVVNDSNEDEKKNSVIINPIDTLPHKNKLSGNYIKDKKNFISLRDGKNANSYLFFIHFEKKEGSCTGELKGVMKMKTPTTALYAEGGDPCVIDFTFDGNSITIKEKGSCGNRRGMNCFFDDTFIRKKEPKPARKK
ncbi:hypothetical protein GALL_58890 [mine drainage metagenome]|uniref:Lipoprotein n=1 Tax=mine drainage metagenome TaxID=410659 RepID=A0A1J5TLD9_9ZZZZ